MTDNRRMLLPFLWRTLIWFDEGLQHRLREHGMVTTSRVQSQVIGNIGAGETRPSRLARNVGITPQTISYVLRDLIKSGLVESTPDENDGRARIMRLTPAGEEYLATIRAIARDLEDVLETRFGRPVVEIVRMVLQTDWSLPYPRSSAA